MKGIKLSKTSWLILSAGVFVVVLAGLGLTRSQQMRQQTDLDQALDITSARLDSLDFTQLELQKAELQQKIDEGTIELDEVKNRMRQTVVSVDVVDEFFKIAAYSNVEILSIRTSAISDGMLGNVSCLTTTINAAIKGEEEDLIDMVINLNNGFTTGVVKTVGISINNEDEEESEDKKSSASLNVEVYSYEGE